MDNLLAGYGSDSDQSSPLPTDNGNGNQRSSHETKSAPISSLLGDGIDSCSSSSDEDETTKDQTSHSLPNKNAIRQDSLTQTKKKQRLHEDNDNTGPNPKNGNSFLTRNALPLPRLASIDSPSMTFWTADYLSQKTSSTIVDHSTTVPRQFTKFEKLLASQPYDPKKGWAAHLRNQNDFHNPHHIQTTMGYFDIKECLGSQAEKRTVPKQSRFRSVKACDLDLER